MQLYFRPFACSLASRVALIETGEDAGYALVQGQALENGGDFRDLNSLGYVPALDLGEADVLTENTAILQYIADRRPEAGLLPPVGSPERYRVLQWLGFVSTELHSKLFAPVFASDAPEEMKAFARERGKSRFDRLAKHLEGREHLTDSFTIADAYLVTVLNWCELAGVDITAWPTLADYRARLRRRPSVAQAMAAERPLLKAA